MKTIIRTLLVSLILPFAASAAVIQTESKPAPAAQVQDSPKWQETRDAFLAFALDKAKSYTDKAETAVSKAVDVAQKEIPETVAQFLRWRFWYHTLVALGSILGLAGSIWLFIHHWPKFSISYYGNIDKGTGLNLIATVVGATGAVVFGLMTAIAGLSNLMSAIEIVVAPRIYLVEQVAHLFGH